VATRRRRNSLRASAVTKSLSARLQAFTREIVPVLDDYIPGRDTGPRRKNIYRSPVPDES